ncbi:GIY-YIG nuclease family protein [Pseudomonas sp. CGJS7]|uniref:GIY-YIG nuclease family protein n=1 Tax=Pseudomonas sp. CGJS7 TaxID=3109348 RepID=UPI00300B24C9
MSFLRSSEPEKVHGASEGRCFLYVLPCAYEDLLKLGFSRNPLARAQQLQPRYFEFFDLDRAFAVQTDHVREARGLELRLRHLLSEHNAPAPLTVRAQAGGHSEWYRGAYPELERQARALLDQGHTVHRPLRDWFAGELSAQGDFLFDRTQELLSQLQGELDLLDAPPLAVLRRNLLDTLDAHAALGVDLAQRLPEPLLRWYRGG